MPLSKEHIYSKKLRRLVSAESWDQNFVKGQGTYRGFIKMRGSEDNTWINKADISGNSEFYFPDRGMNFSGIMLLENATLEMICHYGVRYDIDPVFFAQHKCGRYTFDKEEFPPYEFQSDPLEQPLWLHMDSEVVHYTPKHRESSMKKLRSSALRLDGSLFIILVDKRTNNEPNREKDLSRGDLHVTVRIGSSPPVPQKMGSGSSAWWDNVFESVWEWITEEPFELRLSLIELIFRQEQKSGGAARVLVGLFKLFDSNARMEDLQRSAGDLTLAAIAAPDMETFKSLNERRREFAELQGILLNKEDAEAEDACFEEVTSGLQFSLPELPSKQYERLKSNGRILNQELNTIFKTLIGTITLMDSRANQESAKQSKIQAEKATMLTLLAAFYLPLTLCTGIFGMNIDKIVGSPGPGWLWVVVVLVALLIPSAGFIAYLFRREKWWFWRSWGVFKSKKVTQTRETRKRDSSSKSS